MSTPRAGPSRTGIAVAAVTVVAATTVFRGGTFLLLATAALVVALLAGHGSGPSGRTSRRGALWVAGGVVALPLLFGSVVALGGALSEDFGSEDGPDDQSATLASGELKRGDLTRQVRAALERQGHPAGGLDCPTLSGPATEDSYPCTGSVAGWDRVVVNLHPQGDFTVVGVDP